MSLDPLTPEWAAPSVAKLETRLAAKNAELTKLKADVERLRGTVKEVHDRMHYLLEPDEDGELDMKEVRGCVEDYLGMLARTLSPSEKQLTEGLENRKDL